MLRRCLWVPCSRPCAQKPTATDISLTVYLLHCPCLGICISSGGKFPMNAPQPGFLVDCDSEKIWELLLFCNQSLKPMRLLEEWLLFWTWSSTRQGLTGGHGAQVGTGWDSNLQADPFLGNSQPEIDVQLMSVTRIGEVNGVNTFNTSRTGAGH